MSRDFIKSFHNLKVALKKKKSKSQTLYSRIGNVIFMMRVISEKVIKMQKDVPLCFINCTKAFHKLRYKHLLETVGKLDLFRNDVRIIQYLY